MLCPELVGRHDAMDTLRRRLSGGGVVHVVGPAGLGKSRLVREALHGAGSLVLAGRAVPAENPSLYRPLAEALLSAFRDRPLPAHPSLAGFEGHLARVMPGWGTTSTADDSPVLLAEALVRLLAVLAEEQPCVLLLEDIHWADPESLAVIEYLGDALRGDDVVCVCTARPDASVASLLERVERHEAVDIIRLAPLSAGEVDRVVAACLGARDAPAGLADFVQAHSDGSPFLIEELLAGLVADGALRAHEDRWEVTGALTPALPASLRDSIGRRLTALDPRARRVLGAASLLGRIFDWELLPGIADVDGRAAADALRAASDAQLIEVDGTGFRFRHALTREAVLADLLPPERRDLATRAWPAIERAHPGLPGPYCQLAADLAEAAGEHDVAAARLVECAQRALAAGALATAEATVRRARDLVDDDAPASLDADEVLVSVLAAAGKSADALQTAEQLSARLSDADAPRPRRADLLVAMVRAALAGGEIAAAGELAADARRVAGDDAPPTLLARIDAVSAEAALDRAALDEAELLARRAIDGATATDQPAVQCEALLILGRVIRPRERTEAIEHFEQAAEIAERAGLARWHLRAQQELALQRWSDGLEPMLETRELAARYGSYVTVAAMDLGIANFALANFDRDGCLRAAAACVDASRRYRLASEPVAHLWLAGAHALADDDDAMNDAIAAALASDPDDPRMLADLYGRVLATRAFVRDELDTLPALLDQMMDHVRKAPATTSVYPGRTTWILLHVIDDDDHGAAALAEYRMTTAPYDLEVFALFGQIAEAIAAARGGDTEHTARVDQALDALMSAAIGHGVGYASSLVVARAAIRDGWGEPARWLRRSEAWFAERRFDRLVRRSRALLAEAGAPVPRRGRGTSDVPASLRALGITSRELDVLRLVIDGRSTKEIAAELYLSPKTVERHLSSLFDRTGVRSRQALAEVGVEHLR